MRREDLSKKTKQALLAIAQQQGVAGASRLRKPELIEKLMQTLASPADAAPSASPAPLVSRKSQPKAKSQSKQATPSPSTKNLSSRASKPRLSEQTERPTSLEINKDRHENPIVIVSTGLPEPTSQVISPEQATSVQPGHDQIDLAHAAAEKKFFLGPQLEASVARQDTLPASYDDNRLVLLARDPYWLYAYWDFDAARFSNGHSQLAGNEHRLVLRVFDVTYLEFNGQNAWSTADIELAPFATNWYIPVPQAETAYCIELGYRSEDGQFIALGRSNTVVTPQADVSLNTTVRWLTPFERRMTTSSPTHAPRSTFAQEETPGSLSHDQAASTLSSAEHPFSWGAGHKITTTLPK